MEKARSDLILEILQRENYRYFKNIQREEKNVILKL